MARMGWAFFFVGLLAFAQVGSADVLRWDSGQTISGTKGITPGPGAVLSHLDLEMAGLSNFDLTGATFFRSRLTDATFGRSTIAGASFRDTTSRGFTKDQFYSTASYRAKKLQGVDLSFNDLSDWNLSGQDLSNAAFFETILMRVNFAGSTVAGTDFDFATLGGFDKQQLYSTSSYKLRDLNGMGLGGNNLSGWDLSGMNLLNTNFAYSNINNTNFIGSNLQNASLADTIGIETAQFSSATTYNQWTVFPDGFDPVAAGLRLVYTAPGDFNLNGILDSADIDVLSAKIQGGLVRPAQRPIYDLNHDDKIDEADATAWLHDLKHTVIGDANLDGDFDSGDLVDVFQTGKFEQSSATDVSWGAGDWDLDGAFSSTDLVVAFQEGKYDQSSARFAVASVPEPTTACLVTLGCLMMQRMLRRRRSN